MEKRCDDVPPPANRGLFMIVDWGLLSRAQEHGLSSVVRNGRGLLIVSEEFCEGCVVPLAMLIRAGGTDRRGTRRLTSMFTK